jgi:hypothetical protein
MGTIHEITGVSGSETMRMKLSTCDQWRDCPQMMTSWLQRKKLPEIEHHQAALVTWHRVWIGFTEGTQLETTNSNSTIANLHTLQLLYCRVFIPCVATVTHIYESGQRNVKYFVNLNFHCFDVHFINAPLSISTEMSREIRRYISIPANNRTEDFVQNMYFSKFVHTVWLLHVLLLV